MVAMSFEKQKTFFLVACCFVAGVWGIKEREAMRILSRAEALMANTRKNEDKSDFCAQRACCLNGKIFAVKR